MICSIGIFAIQIKKVIEYKKDEKISIEGFLQSQPPVVPVIDNNQPVSKFSKNITKNFGCLQSVQYFSVYYYIQAKCFNNQRWNKQLMSLPFYLILSMFFFILFIISPILKENLDGQEKLQLKDNIIQILLNVILPLMICARNDKILKHLRSEFHFQILQKLLSQLS